MKIKTNSDVKIIRFNTSIAIVVLGVLAFLDIYQVFSESRKLSLLWIIFLLCLFLINALSVSWGLLTLWRPKSVERVDQVLIKLRGRIKFLNWVIVLMVACSIGHEAIRLRLAQHIIRDLYCCHRCTYY
jgi:hypothetical protein